MSEQEVVTFMVNSVNQDNRELCERGGMSLEETNSQIEQSQPSLHLLMTNLYSRMKAENLIA